MHTTGMSFKAIGRQMGYHYTVVSRLVRKHTIQQCERLTDRDDRALQRLAGRMPFATSPVLKQHWLPACSHEIYTPKPLLSLHRKGQLAECCLGYRLYFCVSKPSFQASSFKSSNRLPPKRSRDFCSLASHEPGFESHRAYFGHVMPSYTCPETSCKPLLSLHRKGQLAGCSLGYRLYFCVSNPHPAVGYMKQKPALV
jgi:hypothetical protein